MLAASVVFWALIAAGADNYDAACQQADARISAFDRAVQSGDQGAITRAGLELQADPLAVRRLNNNPAAEATRVAHNNLTSQIKNNTIDSARAQIAQQYQVKPEQVTFYTATNPQKPGEPTKVGQDWDVTARVNGRDVPVDVAKPIINNSYYQSAGGQQTFGANSTPAQVGHQQAIEVTTYQHPEAYGGSKSEGQRIIEGPKDQRLRDPTQLSEVIKYKSDAAAQQAQNLEAQGRGGDAEGWKLEEARQGIKQFESQVQPRVEAMGGTVPNQVREGMNVLGEVRDGTLSPEEARVKLQGMGETPASIIDKSAGLVEASQTLKPPSERGPAPQDVFVDNVKDRLEMNRAEGRAPVTAEQLETVRQERGLPAPEETGRGQHPLTEGRSSFQEPTTGERITAAAGEVDGRIGSALGVGELPAGASGTRMAVNEVGATVVKGGGLVMAGVAVVETASESFQGGRAAGEGLQALAAGDTQKAQEKFGEAADKGKNVGIIVGITAAAEAMPQTAALIGAGMAGYQGGRYVLNNTSAGQAVDKGALNLIDSGTRAAEALPGALMNALGYQTADQRQLTQKQETYLRALAAGTIQLRDGVTIKDVMDQIKYGEPGTYNERMNELISRDPRAQPDKKPGDIAAQLNELASRITDPNLSRADKDKAQLEYLQILSQIKKPKDEDKEKGEKPGEGGEVAGSETNTPGTEVTGGEGGEPGVEVSGGETNEPGAEVTGEEPTEGGETEVTEGEEPATDDEEIAPEEEEAIDAGGSVFGDEEETGEPEPEGDDLEMSEAGYGETVDGSEPPEVDPNTQGGIQQFAESNEQGLPGTEDFGLMETASQGNEASTAGDGELLNARNTRNQGGADAQETVNQGASEVAQGDANDSWGNTMGNAVQQGVEQGAGAFGTAVGANVADQVGGNVFGPAPSTNSSSGSTDGNDNGDDAEQGETVASGSSPSVPPPAPSSPQTAQGPAPSPPSPPPPPPPAESGGGMCPNCHIPLIRCSDGDWRCPNSSWVQQNPGGAQPPAGSTLTTPAPPTGFSGDGGSQPLYTPAQNLGNPEPAGGFAK